MNRRVVITAMGVVSSLGDSSDAIADNVCNARVSFARTAFDPDVVVAPLNAFDLRNYTGRHKNLRYLNRGAAISVAAAMSALHHAGLSPEQLASAGLFVGAGPNLDLGGECDRIEAGRIVPEKIAALWILRFLPNTAASTIAQLAGIHGENMTLGNACAASLQAIGEGFRRIRHGDLDVAVAGGGDSRLSPGAILAYRKARALYCGERRPDRASRPFDQHRQGFVPGEGGGFFVLESSDHAIRRGAPIMAEICGYASSMDGHAMTAPHPDARWAETAVRGALDDAGSDPGQVEMISSHGTGTLLNDQVEASMIQRIFDQSKPFVLALKSWIGHLASACGAVELAVGLSSMETGLWPEVRNLEAPCNPNLNYVYRKTLAAPGTLVFQNFGFGGQNAALVVRRWQP